MTQVLGKPVTFEDPPPAQDHAANVPPSLDQGQGVDQGRGGGRPVATEGLDDVQGRDVAPVSRCDPQIGRRGGPRRRLYGSVARARVDESCEDHRLSSSRRLARPPIWIGVWRLIKALVNCRPGPSTPSNPLGVEVDRTDPGR